MPQLSRGASVAVSIIAAHVGASLPALPGFDRYRKANLPVHSPLPAPLAPYLFRPPSDRRESILVQIDRVRSDWSAKVALIPDTRPHQSDRRHWQSIERSTRLTTSSSLGSRRDGAVRSAGTAPRYRDSSLR